MSAESLLLVILSIGFNPELESLSVWNLDSIHQDSRYLWQWIAITSLLNGCLENPHLRRRDPGFRTIQLPSNLSAFGQLDSLKGTLLLLDNPVLSSLEGLEQPHIYRWLPRDNRQVHPK